MTTSTGGRLMQTPEIEPLTIRPEEQARNVVDLIHRSVERYPGSRGDALEAAKGPTAQRATTRRHGRAGRTGSCGTGSPPSRSGCETSASRTATASRSSPGPGPSGRSPTLPRSRLGAVTCPIYPQSEAGQAAFVINNVGAKVIFVENTQQAHKIESIRSECPTLEHVISIEASGKLPPGTLTLDDVMARADLDAANRIAWQDAMKKVDRDHHATVIHTSGTTANPKGAILSHGNLLYNFEAAMQVIDFYETDVFLAFPAAEPHLRRIVDEMVALGRGAAGRLRRGAHRAAAGEHGRGRADGHGLGSAPLRAGLCARPGRGRVWVTDAPTDLPLGGGPWPREVRQPPRPQGPDSPWLTLQLRLADALVFGKIRARTGGRVRYFVSGSAPLAREIGEFFYGMGCSCSRGTA
jgi:long-chain acyl-CoA synthetase